MAEWLEILNPIAATIVSVAAVWVTWFQKKIAHAKLQLELIDRRMTMYDTLVETIHHVWVHSKPNPHANYALNKARNTADLVGNRYISEYIEDFRKKVVALQYCLIKLEMPDNQNNVDLVEEKYDLCRWIVNQGESGALHDKFRDLVRVEY